MARHVERLMGIASAGALVVGIAMIDERVRSFVTNAISASSLDELAVNVGHSRQLVHTLYASVSQNPVYGPLAAFALAAAGLALLMLRA